MFILGEMGGAPKAAEHEAAELFGGSEGRQFNRLESAA